MIRSIQPGLVITDAVYRCQRAARGSIKQPKFAAAAARHFTALLQRFFQPFCSAALRVGSQ